MLFYLYACVVLLCACVVLFVCLCCFIMCLCCFIICLCCFIMCLCCFICMLVFLVVVFLVVCCVLNFTLPDTYPEVVPVTAVSSPGQLTNKQQTAITETLNQEVLYSMCLGLMGQCVGVGQYQ